MPAKPEVSICCKKAGIDMAFHRKRPPQNDRLICKNMSPTLGFQKRRDFGRAAFDLCIHFFCDFLNLIHFLVAASTHDNLLLRSLISAPRPYYRSSALTNGIDFPADLFCAIRDDQRHFPAFLLSLACFPAGNHSRMHPPAIRRQNVFPELCLVTAKGCR